MLKQFYQNRKIGNISIPDQSKALHSSSNPIMNNQKKLPRTITKGELRNLFGITSWYKWRKKYFTDEVIFELGFRTYAQFKNAREFTPGQTAKIFEYFNVYPEELN